MNKYQIVFWGYLFIWTICILDCRTTICKKSILWTFIITIIGMIFVLTSVAINCYLAYHEGFTAIQYDPNIVLDTLLLKMTKTNENLFYWHMATFGDSFLISGLEVPILCKLLKKGIIPVRKSRE